MMKFKQQIKQLHPRNRPARLEKLKQIKDDLDKEIEYIVIEDKNEIEETGYEPPPLVHPRERFKTFKKTLEKVVDEIKVLGQMPLPPKKRLDRIEKLKKKKKKERKKKMKYKFWVTHLCTKEMKLKLI